MKAASPCSNGAEWRIAHVGLILLACHGLLLPWLGLAHIAARYCMPAMAWLGVVCVVGMGDSWGGHFAGRLNRVRRRARAQVLPESKALRGRVISLLHRLVECLGERLLPSLPAALAALLPATADAADVTDTAALLGQLAQRYKAALAPLLAKVPYFPLVTPRHPCCSSLRAG